MKIEQFYNTDELKYFAKRAKKTKSKRIKNKYHKKINEIMEVNMILAGLYVDAEIMKVFEEHEEIRPGERMHFKI